MSGERLGELLESSDTLPLLQAQALDTSLNPTLFENRKAEGEAGSGTPLPVPAQIPITQQKPGSWEEPQLTSWEEPGLTVPRPGKMAHMLTQ